MTLSQAMTSNRIDQTEYKSHDAYVEHQVSKTKAILTSPQSTTALYQWNMKYRRALRETLDYDFIVPGTSVVCLGARAGGEVKAFIDKRCFAVGIDLFPVPNSYHVVKGDFNDIQYAGESVDIVFTNSLDHSNDLVKTVSEVHRILKPGGHFIVEIMSDGDDWHDQWACCHWKSVAAVINQIQKGGLEVVCEKKMPNTNRLFGTQLCFRRSL